MLQHNIKALGLLVLDKNIFSLFGLDMQRTSTIWTIIKKGHIRINPAKFGQNPASSLGGDVI